jgi:hypothetical protein
VASVTALLRYLNSSSDLRGIIRSAYLEEAYRGTAKKHENVMSKWEEWKVTVQIGVMGSYFSNGSNGKLLSKWEKWEVTVQIGVMGSNCPMGVMETYCPNESNGK